MRKGIWGKRIGAALLTATIMLTLGGCGNGGTGSSGAAQSSTEAATAVPSSQSAESVASKQSSSESVKQEETKDTGETVTVTDHAGRTVTVKKDPQRVAILDILPLPATLTVFLNSAKNIVAMEPASMNAAKNGILAELYPEILNADTDIMNGDDVNVEALMALNPDVVFYSGRNEELAKKLENSGLTCVAVSPTKWNYDCIKTYDNWISLLGQIFPSAEAAKKTEESSVRAREVEEKIKEKTGALKEGEKKKVLFLFRYDENGIITSGAHFFGQWWCDASGGINVAKEVPAENTAAKITMEQVYKWNPDVIFITNFTQTLPEDLYHNVIGSDDWSTVEAVKKKQVYKLPLGSYRTYTPGIDTPMTLEWMAKTLYPDLFPEFDVKKDVKAYYKDLYGIALTDAQFEAMYHPERAAGRMNK